MTETHANGYSSESTQQELSYEYPHDLVWMIFITFCIAANWTKITSASEGLSLVSTEMFTRPSYPSRPVHTETISIPRGYSIAAGSI